MENQERKSSWDDLVREIGVEVPNEVRQREEAATAAKPEPQIAPPVESRPAPPLPPKKSAVNWDSLAGELGLPPSERPNPPAAPPKEERAAPRSEERPAFRSSEPPSRPRSVSQDADRQPQREREGEREGRPSRGRQERGERPERPVQTEREDRGGGSGERSGERESRPTRGERGRRDDRGRSDRGQRVAREPQQRVSDDRDDREEVSSHQEQGDRPEASGEPDQGPSRSRRGRGGRGRRGRGQRDSTREQGSESQGARDENRGRRSNRSDRGREDGAGRSEIVEEVEESITYSRTEESEIRSESPREEPPKMGAAVSLWHKIFGGPSEPAACSEEPPKYRAEYSSPSDEQDEPRGAGAGFADAHPTSDLDAPKYRDDGERGEPTGCTDDGSEGEKRGRRRRGRGRGRSENRSSDERTTGRSEGSGTRREGRVDIDDAIDDDSSDDLLDDLGGVADDDDDNDDELAEDQGSGRSRSVLQRAIPSWDEAIGFIVESNMSTRTQRRPPGRSGSREGSSRGGRSRGRRSGGSQNNN